MTYLLVNTHKWLPPSPPAALDYIAWELEKIGISSEIVDFSFVEDVQQFRSLLQNQYDGVCLTIRNLEKTAFSKTLHFPLPAIKTLVEFIKQHCDCPIIVGGNGFSVAPEKILAYVNADYGIHGGGEASLPLLIQYIKEGTPPLSQIPHVVYRENSTITATPGVYKKRLPPVKRGYIDYHRYWCNHPAGFANIETKRGCPHRCVFCVEPAIKGRSIQVKPPEAVCAEVDWFLKEGMSHFFLTDSEFNTSHDAAVSLLHHWIEKGYQNKIHWVAYATPAHFSEELASLLPESGNVCTMIDFGHISDRILSHLGKDYTAKDIETVLSLCHDYKVTFKGSLMLGGPGETRETVKQAIEFFKTVDCEMFVVLGIRVFPNTPLGEHIKKMGVKDNPNLYGKVIDNDDLFEPIYYISHALGEDIFDYIAELTGTSQQFYTITTPFRITSTINGHFRGVNPGYESVGHLETQYLVS